MITGFLKDYFFNSQPHLKVMPRQSTEKKLNKAKNKQSIQAPKGKPAYKAENIF